MGHSTSINIRPLLFLTTPHRDYEQYFIHRESRKLPPHPVFLLPASVFTSLIQCVKDIRTKRTDMTSSSLASRSPRNIFGLAHTFSVRKTSPPLSVDSVDTVGGHHSSTDSTTEPIMESYSAPLTNAPTMKRGVQHISRKELYTNLEARVKYLHSFLDFNSGQYPISTSEARA